MLQCRHASAHIIMCFSVIRVVSCADLNQQQLFGNSFTTKICLLLDRVMDSGVFDFS